MISMRNCSNFLGMDLVKPELNFVEISEGMGVSAVRVDSQISLNTALLEANNKSEPTLIEVMVSTQ